ncbi:hypothetical protein BC835DRAFT_1311160 [Cytidiella melzeri]|nr:hypothetical protein BC835DRAFT_1311160 [Cytidiella melzeri]
MTKSEEQKAATIQKLATAYSTDQSIHKAQTSITMRDEEYNVGVGKTVKIRRWFEKIPGWKAKGYGRLQKTGSQSCESFGDLEQDHPSPRLLDFLAGAIALVRQEHWPE